MIDFFCKTYGLAKPRTYRRIARKEYLALAKQKKRGAKYDVSIDEKGHAKLEKITFDPYNESGVLQHAVENYRKRTGHYPARILVDQIYWTRENRAFCKEHGIRMSGPKLGRPDKDHKTSRDEYQDNTDRIEVERFFSVSKRCYGAGLIMTKLEETTLASIALSVLVANKIGRAHV